MESELIGLECKHAVYTKGNYDSSGKQNDLVFVKLKKHHKDGTITNHTELIYNYERPFWITKPGYRNHEQKKEHESIDRLDKYMTRQSELINSIKKVIRVKGRRLKEVCESPFIYGADITSTTLIKESYQRKYPDLMSENTIAVLDIETDVVHGTDDPILISLTMKDKAICVATSLYTKDVPNYEERLNKHFYKRISEIPEIQSRNIKLEILAVDTPLDAIKAVIGKAHIWQPDLITIWNINFDIKEILKTIDKYGGDAGDIFSDPSVPSQFRKCYYREGPPQKVTVSGKAEPLHWTDRWHTLHCPASFYFVDQACIFRKLRMAFGKEQSYALDAILKKYTNVSKLKNEKADTMGGLEWHQYMQVHDKIDYAVYNIVDCVACEILDELPTVGDCREAISVVCGYSDYDIFNSQPKRTIDDMYFLCLELGHVIATMPTDIETEYDKLTHSISGWIITLPAHLIQEVGLKIIKEMPHLDTLFFRAVYDLDIEAAYPNGEDILNASKSTTVAEPIAVEGVTTDHLKLIGLNLNAGAANANEIMISVCKAPTLDMILNAYDTQFNNNGKSDKSNFKGKLTSDLI